MFSGTPCIFRKTRHATWAKSEVSASRAVAFSNVELNKDDIFFRLVNPSPGTVL